MTIGITNAKIISGGSGGGDTVYAVSETALNKDDKVYLNKHYTGDYEADTASTSANASQNGVIYIKNNGDLVWALKGALYHSIYSSEDKNWITRSYTISEYARKAIVKMGDYLVCKIYGNIDTSSKEHFIFETEAVEITGRILRPDLALTYTKTKQFDLVEIVNPQTGEMGQTYCSVAHGGSQYLAAAVLEGNTLFILDTAGKYSFYDISDLTSPIQISTGTCDFKSVTVFTGLSEGHYIFGAKNYNAGYTNGNESGVTNILKIDSEYNLVAANDLPSEFYARMASGEVSYVFNKENNILTAGTENSAVVYKWDGKTFKNLRTIETPIADGTPKDKYTFCLHFSQDMYTYSFFWVVSGSSSYLKTRTHTYKVPKNNDNWYAEDFNHINPVSLQGFATGKTNDKGEYEVSTVLPKKINLTINTNVDTVVEILGSVE